MTRFATFQYILNLDTMNIITSDGHIVSVDDDRRKIVETVEPIPGAEYIVVCGSEQERLEGWYAFMKYIGIPV